MTAIPKFYGIVNALIAEIAKERGEDPEVFKEAILAKIRTGAEGASIRTSRSSEHDTEGDR